ncbi:MAG: BatA domain-containing protein, partial [Planctomycetota bacterium]|nr:BatA domain-containing protein [Planctomycetota bacterium]
MNPLPDTFNNPQLWPLLLFAILPALLYFIDRRRARRIDWPALRFFLNRQKGKLRWMRLREALLISVRTLALALIVYALLGPVSLVEKELGADSTSSRGLVLAFDTSFSMSYRPDGEGGNLLDRAKARGRRLLAELKPGDAALLLDPARPPGEAAGELFRREKNRAELEEISLGAGRFELLHAIDDAIEGASRLPSTVRE